MNPSMLLCIEASFQSLSSSKDPVLYKDRVLEQMLKTEEMLAVNPNYLDVMQGGCLTEQTRRDVVGWMDLVCENHGCCLQVFPLAVNFLDRMLSYVKIQPEDLQVTATACLLIASKLMQAEPFSIAKLRKMARLSSADILENELFVLGKLKWDLCAVTPFDFVENLLERLDFTKRQRRAISLKVRHLVVISCLEYRFIMYPPSLIAAGAVCVAARLLRLKLNHTKDGCGPTLPELLHKITRTDQEFIETCQEQLCDALKRGQAL